MAIAYVSKADSTLTEAVSSVSTSFTVAAGSNRCLVVCSGVRASGATPASITGVTFNTSEAFSLGRGETKTAGGPSWRSEIWYLKNPTVTTANVVVTYASAANDQSIAITILSFTGVDQTTPLDANNGASGLGTTLAVTVTTVAANAWLVDSAVGRPAGGLTVGTSGLTQNAKTTRIYGSTSYGISTVDGKATPGGEVLDWTQASGDEWVTAGISLKPASAGQLLAVNAGSYIVTGIDMILRIASPLYLRYRK